MNPLLSISFVLLLVLLTALMMRRQAWVGSPPSPAHDHRVSFLRVTVCPHGVHGVERRLRVQNPAVGRRVLRELGSSTSAVLLHLREGEWQVWMGRHLGVSPTSPERGVLAEFTSEGRPTVLAEDPGRQPHDVPYPYPARTSAPAPTSHHT